MQGWDKEARKTVYFFRTDNNVWGYYDKETSQVIEPNQWKGKSVFVSGHWVAMALYHRLYLRFTQQVSYSIWDTASKKQAQLSTQNAIVTVTDTAYKSLLKQANGRDPNSIYKFVFTSRKMGKKNVTYVKSAVWVS